MAKYVTDMTDADWVAIATNLVEELQDPLESQNIGEIVNILIDAINKLDKSERKLKEQLLNGEYTSELESKVEKLHERNQTLHGRIKTLETKVDTILQNDSTVNINFESTSPQIIDVTGKTPKEIEGMLRDSSDTTLDKWLKETGGRVFIADSQSALDEAYANVMPGDLIRVVEEDKE